MLLFITVHIKISVQGGYVHVRKGFGRYEIKCDNIQGVRSSVM